MKTISDKIFELLKEKGMSQKEFAQRTAILVFCKYRKEFDDKTLKAYRIDLRQYFECQITPFLKRLC